MKLRVNACEINEVIEMRIGRLFQAALCLMAMGVVFIGLTDSADANDQHSEKVKASFLAHINSLGSISTAQKAAIVKTVSEINSDFSDTLTDSLILMYPQYSDAIAASDVSGGYERAIELLSPLQHSEDKYLAGDASFYLARTLMNEERFEDATPCLQKLVGDLSSYTVHQGSAQYYLGVAQAGLLKNQEATESLMRFLQFNPNAPERLRVSAWRQVQQIQSIQKGKLDDVYQRMDYSRRRLELVETDEVTQAEQDKIVSMLTKLIKEEEKKEVSSNVKKGGPSEESKKSSGQKQAQSKPSQSKNSQKGGMSSNPNGQVVRKSYDDSPASPWSRLRDRSRDPANNAVKEKLPARYRDIVERYTEAANGTGEK